MAANFSRKRRLRQALYCGHCKRDVPHATFYRHKEKYYNAENDSWVPQVASRDSVSDDHSADNDSDTAANMQGTLNQQEHEG